MRTLRIYVACLLAVWPATKASAQDMISPPIGDSSSRDNTPARSAGQVPSIRDLDTAYEALLNEVLLINSEPNPYVRMVCRPSFNREWMVTIKPPQEDSAEVQSVVVKQGIWPILMNPNPTKIETDVAVARISKTTARKLRLAWIVMLTNTRNMEPRDRGLDGTTYRFAAFIQGHRTLTYEAWQPQRKYPSGLLVELGEMLKDLVQAETKDRPEHEALIRHKVDNLLGQIPVLDWQERLLDSGG
jgi:hypothetical protein